MKMEKKREGSQQQSSEAKLTKPAGMWYLLKEALQAAYKILHLPAGAQARSAKKTLRYRCAARQMQ